MRFGLSLLICPDFERYNGFVFLFLGAGQNLSRLTWYLCFLSLSLEVPQPLNTAPHMAACLSCGSWFL